MNQCPKHRQTPPLPSRNKWWGNVATDPDDKVHDGAPDPQGHPLTRRGHIGSSSPAEASKPLWPLPPLSQPQPPTLTPTAMVPKGRRRSTIPPFRRFSVPPVPSAEHTPTAMMQGSSRSLVLLQKGAGTRPEGSAIVRGSLGPPLNYPPPTTHNPLLPDPTTHSPLHPHHNTAANPPSFLYHRAGVPQSVMQSPTSCTMYTVCPCNPPRWSSNVFFRVFCEKKYEIVVLKDSFSGAFSREFRDFLTFPPDHSTARSTHLQIPSGAGGGGGFESAASLAQSTFTLHHFNV